jgi:hypothetical protein
MKKIFFLFLVILVTLSQANPFEIEDIYDSIVNFTSSDNIYMYGENSLEEDSEFYNLIGDLPDDGRDYPNNKYYRIPNSGYFQGVPDDSYAEYLRKKRIDDFSRY